MLNTARKRPNLLLGRWKNCLERLLVTLKFAKKLKRNLKKLSLKLEALQAWLRQKKTPEKFKDPQSRE